MVISTAIPAPPRTPTPPSEEDDHVQADALGLQQETHNAYSPGKFNHGREDMLSPMSNTFAGNRQSPSYMNSPSFPPSLNSPRAFGNASTPVDQSFHSRRKSVMNDFDGSQVNGTENRPGPFGFQTVEYTVGRPPAGKSVRMRNSCLLVFRTVVAEMRPELCANIKDLNRLLDSDVGISTNIAASHISSFSSRRLGHLCSCLHRYQHLP